MLVFVTFLANIIVTFLGKNQLLPFNNNHKLKTNIPRFKMKCQISEKGSLKGLEVSHANLVEEEE